MTLDKQDAGRNRPEKSLSSIYFRGGSPTRWSAHHHRGSWRARQRHRRQGISGRHGGPVVREPRATGVPRYQRPLRAQSAKLSFFHAFNSMSTDVAIECAEALLGARTGSHGARVLRDLRAAMPTKLSSKLIWYYNNLLGRPKKKKIISRWNCVSRLRHRHGKPHRLAGHAYFVRPAHGADPACDLPAPLPPGTARYDRAPVLATPGEGVGELISGKERTPSRRSSPNR